MQLSSWLSFLVGCSLLTAVAGQRDRCYEIRDYGRSGRCHRCRDGYRFYQRSNCDYDRRCCYGYCIDDRHSDGVTEGGML
ncbi:uncharacterized protein BO66DRAFT_388299 [Aspergillus aculeatinus CBS 121060]|uniref:Uncharacterized protein n=1 Tax=Aspergillus aculeatinus CBS 121060 TaxID=1448322 RepID=A0ACD1HKZ2_9EURO|nr:hypothetical protein BO66DRAFT_388299 [Aspergillus aculeatinus CBS 121060]RAH74246.1 hypothetical protein BO66DRAFT_388299 [Aspergillus aculeatinus CBS 121060]